MEIDESSVPGGGTRSLKEEMEARLLAARCDQDPQMAAPSKFSQVSHSQDGFHPMTEPETAADEAEVARFAEQLLKLQ